MNMKKNVGALVLAAAMSAGAVGVADAAYEPGRVFFEYNYFYPNANNQADYPESFNGIKTYFRSNEHLLLEGHDPNWYTGEDVEWAVYGPNGNLVFAKDQIQIFNGGWERVGSNGDLMSYLLSSPNGGYGNYRVLWYDKPYGAGYDYQFDGESDFNISQ